MSALNLKAKAFTASLKVLSEENRLILVTSPGPIEIALYRLDCEDFLWGKPRVRCKFIM